jgi:hypothetical protein
VHNETPVFDHRHPLAVRYNSEPAPLPTTPSEQD